MSNIMSFFKIFLTTGWDSFIEYLNRFNLHRSFCIGGLSFETSLFVQGQDYGHMACRYLPGKLNNSYNTNLAKS